MILPVSPLKKWTRRLTGLRLQVPASSGVQGTAGEIVRDREPKEDVNQAIPPQMFQTAPTGQIGTELWRQLESFRDYNPHLAFRFFDQEQADSYMASAWGDHPISRIYSSARFGQMKADIWRYCIVWEQGGYYLDINKAINTDLRLLHTREATGLLSFERNSSIVLPDDPTSGGLAHPEKVVLQWCFGFEPRHPILSHTIDRVVSLSVFFEERVFDKALGAVVAFTGPGAFTWAVRKFFATSTGRGIAQLAPDFNGLGVTRLPGADSAFSGIKHYSKWTNCHILDQL